MANCEIVSRQSRNYRRDNNLLNSKIIINRTNNNSNIMKEEIIINKKDSKNE